MLGVGTMVVTDRRWSAPLLASALAMGLFIGIAFTPSLTGVNASDSQVLALESPLDPTTEAPAVDTTTGGGGSGGSGPPNDSPAPYSPPATTPYTAPTTTPTDTPAEDLPTEDPPADDPSGGDDTTEPDPGGDGQELVGTVVHVNAISESYVLSARGVLYAIHSSDLPDPGAKVDVTVAELANGTFAEDGNRAEDGTTDAGSLNGFVSHISSSTDTLSYSLSLRGASALIQLPAGAIRADLPKLGSLVDVEVDIQEPPKARHRKSRGGLPILGAILPGASGDSPVPAADTPAPTRAGDCVRTDPLEPAVPEEVLIQKSVKTEGDPFTYFDVAGTVQAVCADAGQISISADDLRAGAEDMTLTVPTDIDLAGLVADEPIVAAVEVAGDGTLSLAATGSDDGSRNADDTKQLQGDYSIK